MLHVPMSNHGGKLLDDGAIIQGMSDAEIEEKLLQQITYLPAAAGVNNHMGSLLTESSSAMRVVMKVLRQKDLFFVDSRTSANSVAYAMAQAQYVPALERHKFLGSWLGILLEFSELKNVTSQQFRQDCWLVPPSGHCIEVLGFVFQGTDTRPDIFRNVFRGFSQYSCKRDNGQSGCDEYPASLRVGELKDAGDWNEDE